MRNRVNVYLSEEANEIWNSLPTGDKSEYICLALIDRYRTGTSKSETNDLSQVLAHAQDVAESLESVYLKAIAHGDDGIDRFEKLMERLEKIVGLADEPAAETVTGELETTLQKQAL